MLFHHGLLGPCDFLVVQRADNSGLENYPERICPNSAIMCDIIASDSG
jgi:hypothetical protein